MTNKIMKIISFILFILSTILMIVYREQSFGLYFYFFWLFSILFFIAKWEKENET